MPIDPVTGVYKPEDASVSNRVQGLIAKDSPLMQQAATKGLKSANRRGLLNSSMAVQAAQAATLDAAVPIASQEAGQAHQSNMQGTDIEAQSRRQGVDIAAQERMQGTEIGARERLQGTELSSRERMQGTDIAAQERLQGTELSARERLQGTELESRERMQGTELAAQSTLQGAELASRERMQQAENALREQLSTLDREAQARIAGMNVAANERTAAATMAAGFEQSYAQMVATIMNNPDIPSEVRQQYLDHAAAVRDSNFALVEQMYGLELEWTTPTTTPGEGGDGGEDGADDGGSDGQSGLAQALNSFRNRDEEDEDGAPRP